MKIKELLNKILNSKIFVIIIGMILFIKTIYFYKSTISVAKQIENQTLIGTSVNVNNLLK